MARPVRGLLLVLTACAASGAFADDCKFTANRAGSLDLAGVERVVVLAGAGDLEVTGSADAKRIEARGKACASSQELLDATTIAVRRDGNVAYVTTNIPKIENRQHAAIDLDISLPPTLAADITDSSGDMDVRNLKSLVAQDSSGDMRIESIAQAVKVRDSSGEITIYNAGSVTLEDSSGDITVRDVKTDVEVTSDSSGGIEIRDVGGNVRIVQDSSGDIRVARVKGNVRVDSDSSGSIVVADIGGDFIVSDDSSGGVKFENVTGKVSVP